MKKGKQKRLHLSKLLCVFLACAALLCACAQSSPGAMNLEDGERAVLTSIYPLYDFASRIAGDKLRVFNMTPAGIEPHDWEPSPSDISNLEHADMLIYNGAGMEHWVDKVIASLENDKLEVVEASAGISLLYGGQDDADPHVWLSPKNAKKQAETIMRAFADMDPDNEKVYAENYTAFAKELDALDQEYAEALSALRQKSLIVSHEAFGYLCADYGLTQMGIEGLSGESGPDPGRMAQLIRYAKENGIQTVFYESLSSPKAAQTIASEIGGQVAPLNPLERLTAEEMEAGEDYLSVMRQNLKTIRQALG